MFLIEKIKKSLFPFYSSPATKKILNILNLENKKQAMFVGGCVRKYILNQKIDDIDIATSLTPNEIIKKFENTDVKIKKTGIEHGTLTLILENQKVEITTLRQDISTDGRHADIEFTDNWKKDSERRDFTINAIYLNSRGKIFDPQFGLEDLKNNKVKFIGEPKKRIQEDYLRILRFLRFSIQYKSFAIDDETQKAIKLNMDGIAKLSKERIYNELEKIINLDNFQDIFKNNFLLNIFKLIFPEFLYLDRIKILKKLKNSKDIEFNKDIVLAIMLLDFSNNHAYFFHKYNISNELKNKLSLFSILLKEIKSNKEFFHKDLKKNIFFHGKKEIEEIFIINNVIINKSLTSKYHEMIKKINETIIPKFPITGNDLIKEGLKKGKKIGEILETIEKKWIENDFKISKKDIKILLNKYLI